MLKGRIAEAILALFTSRTRAASTVGDLLEARAGGGALGFWWSVCRTALSHLWSEFAAEPLFLAKLSFQALLLNLLLGAVAFAGMVISIGLVGAIARPGGAVDPWLPWSPRVFILVGGPVSCAVEFQTGRWIARRARGREMAACVCLTIVTAIATGILSVTHPGISEADREVGIVGNSIANLVAFTSLLAGAIWVRSKSPVTPRA